MPNQRPTSKYKINGFTLIELLSVLALLAILTAIATPSLHHLIVRNEAISNIHKLVLITRLARSSAVSNAATHTLCPSSNGKTCNEHWGDGILLFRDLNQNTVLDANDYIIRFEKPFLENAILTWHASRNYIQFSPRGTPNGTIGSFVYCPKNKDNHYAKTLSLISKGNCVMVKIQTMTGL